MNISETNSISVADLYTQGIIIAVSCGVNLVLSVPTNIYVLWLIVNGAGGTVTSEFIALNLTVSEILFCLSSVFYAASKNIQTTIQTVTSLGKFSLGFLYTGRPMFQSCICVERYLAVVHPVTFLKYKPLRYRVGCCAAVWLLILGNILSYICLIPLVIYTYAVLAQNIVLFFVMLFCCLSVLRALKQPGPGEGDREGAKNTKMRAFKIILIILVSMEICYLPILVIASLLLVLNPVVWYFLYSISFSITLIAGFVQPLLYIYRAGKLPFIRAL